MSFAVGRRINKAEMIKGQLKRQRKVQRPSDNVRAHAYVGLIPTKLFSISFSAQDYKYKRSFPEECVAWHI